MHECRNDGACRRDGEGSHDGAGLAGGWCSRYSGYFWCSGLCVRILVDVTSINLPIYHATFHSNLQRG